MDENSLSFQMFSILLSFIALAILSYGEKIMGVFTLELEFC